ncbi:MAG: hypothetical protein R2818_13185 [Flavobacteriales bacterium]
MLPQPIRSLSVPLWQRASVLLSKACSLCLLAMLLVGSGEVMGQCTNAIDHQPYRSQLAEPCGDRASGCVGQLLPTR